VLQHVQQAAPCCNMCNMGAPCCNMRTLNPLRCNTALSARSKRCSRKVCGPATEERIPFGVWPSVATTVSVEAVWTNTQARLRRRR
jgi:hypothetical protein